eukprot:m.166632 g.166632  ORF g.166632 m.166632 type:complete len:555 (+) comp14445_c0_seq2:345-2009(+)
MLSQHHRHHHHHNQQQQHEQKQRSQCHLHTQQCDFVMASKRYPVMRNTPTKAHLLAFQRIQRLGSRQSFIFQSGTMDLARGRVSKSSSAPALSAAHVELATPRKLHKRQQKGSVAKDQATSSSATSTTTPFTATKTGRPYSGLESLGYAIGPTIGVGGYSKVKVVTKKSNGKQFAVKIISKKQAPNGYLAKFLPREIQALKRIKHANIIQLHEVVESSERIYLITQYAERGDLLDYVNRGGALKETECKRLFYQMLDALQHCHSNNVIHRDLKCENMLIDRNGNVLVSDFGFAALVPTPASYLMTHCGSYAYAAPEILGGKAYDGTKSDIWSLGIILYAMACGRLPYSDKSMKTLLGGTRKKLEYLPSLSKEFVSFMESILVVEVHRRSTIQALLAHPWMRTYASEQRSVLPPTPIATGQPRLSRKAAMTQSMKCHATLKAKSLLTDPSLTLTQDDAPVVVASPAATVCINGTPVDMLSQDLAKLGVVTSLGSPKRTSGPSQSSSSKKSVKLPPVVMCPGEDIVTQHKRAPSGGDERSSRKWNWRKPINVFRRV